MAWAREGPLVGPRWTVFNRRFRAELDWPENRHVLGMLAALSHQAGISLGCYCEDETVCHGAFSGTS